MANKETTSSSLDEQSAAAEAILFSASTDVWGRIRWFNRNSIGIDGRLLEQSQFLFRCPVPVRNFASCVPKTAFLFRYSVPSRTVTPHVIPAASQRAKLLQIPRELRDKILRFILAEPKELHSIHPAIAEDIRIQFKKLSSEFQAKNMSTVLDAQILRANKQLFAEGQEILLRENVFEYSPSRARLLKLAPHIAFYQGSFSYGMNMLKFILFLFNHSDLRSLKIEDLLSEHWWVHDVNLPALCKTLQPLRYIMVRDKVELT